MLLLLSLIVFSASTTDAVPEGDAEEAEATRSAQPSAQPTASVTAAASATPVPTPIFGSERTGPTQLATVVQVTDGDTIKVERPFQSPSSDST